MIENKKDRDATKAARKAKVIRAPSWISYLGHVYLRGADRSFLRQKVFLDAKGICAICKKYCPPHDGDMDHIAGGRKVARCDCLRTKLTDGTRHTNVQWVHGMFSIFPCHRLKHHREMQ